MKGEYNYILYLLVNTFNHRTYLGITNNSIKRLRQHNTEISGGALYTRMYKGNGRWRYYLKVWNLTKTQALSIERTCKNKKCKGKGNTALKRRISVILSVLNERKEKFNMLYIL